jgi:hypothetical protein
VTAMLLTRGQAPRQASSFRLAKPADTVRLRLIIDHIDHAVQGRVLPKRGSRGLYTNGNVQTRFCRDEAKWRATRGTIKMQLSTHDARSL